MRQKFEPDYYQNNDNWQNEMSPYQPEEPYETYYNSYLEPPETNPDADALWKDANHRNPRSRIKPTITTSASTTDSMDYGIYDHKNVQKSRSKLMHDLNNSPTEILKDTYFKNLERQLRKSRFQQRDVKSEADKEKENAQIRSVIEEKKKELLNASESLWDLETEKEEEERKNGYWRGKRAAGNGSVFRGIPGVTSTSNFCLLQPSYCMLLLCVQVACVHITLCLKVRRSYVSMDEVGNERNLTLISSRIFITPRSNFPPTNQEFLRRGVNPLWNFWKFLNI